MIEAYTWGDRSLRFVRCRKCGCVLHHERAKKARSSTIGVNARNLDAAVVAKARATD